MTDPLEAFRAEVAAALGDPGPIVADGRIHRFRTEGERSGSRAGWYLFHADGLPAGSFGSWRDGEAHTWCAKPEAELSKAERAAWKRRMTEARKARDAEREHEAAEARQRAQDAWSKAQEVGPDSHPYLRTKGVQAHGTRVAGGRLIVPVCDLAGDLHSLQLIDAAGVKRFLPGGAVGGHCYRIGEVNGRVFLAEGFATAATIREATGEAAVCAFTAGNLHPVAEALRSAHPLAELVVCADNDQFTDGNPGATKAAEAAEAARGRVVLPSFADLATRPTDFNDLGRLQGLDAVRIQILGPRHGDTPVAQLAAVEQALGAVVYMKDLAPLHATLGTVAANLQAGPPVWLMLVGGPSSGKTEVARAVERLPFARVAAVITEAALLSGVSKKDRAKDAKGGLLAEIGAHGLLVLKDFTSVLSMHRDARGQLLAALREVYDGAWTRLVGTEGGRTLHWAGKLGMVACVTSAIEKAHEVMAQMGERFVLCRMPDFEGAALRGVDFDDITREGERHAALHAAVGELFRGFDPTPPRLGTEAQDRVKGLATLIALARSAVFRDGYNREIDLIADPERPFRVAKALYRLLTGMVAIGVPMPDAWRAVARVGLDSIPILRRQLLEALTTTRAGPATGDLLGGELPGLATADLALALGHPTQTVRRALEDLAAHKVILRRTQGKGRSDLWLITPWARERLVAALALAGVPETSGPMREGDPSGVGGEGVPEMSGTKHSDDPGGDPVCSSSNYTIHVREDISGKVPGEDPETQAGRGFPGDDTPEKGCTPSPATVVDDPFLSALLGGKGADRSALIPVLDDMLGRRARPDDDDPDPAWVEGSL